MHAKDKIFSWLTPCKWVMEVNVNSFLYSWKLVSLGLDRHKVCVCLLYITLMHTEVANTYFIWI